MRETTPHLTGRLLGRALLIVIGLAVGLLIAEAAFRRFYIETESAIFFREGSEQFGWFHIPNKAGWFGLEGEEFRAFVQINSKGLRERELPYEKPPGTYRILILGDSFIEGYQVSQDQTIAKVLERLLNDGRSDLHFEVINAGVGGWGTDNELLFFRHEGYRYRPDLVILGFLAGNDVANNLYVLEDALYHRVLKPYFVLNDDQLELRNFPYQGEMNVAPPKPLRPQPRSLGEALSRWLEDHSRLYQFILFTREHPPVGSEDDQAEPAAVPDTIPIKYELYASESDETWSEAWRITRALIHQLDREVAKRGGQLIVVGLPTKLQVHPDLWQQVLDQYPKMQTVTWDLDKPDRLLADITAELEIPHLVLTAGFQSFAAAHSGYLYFEQDGHWNAAGHRLAAKLTADFLSEQGWIPPAP